MIVKLRTSLLVGTVTAAALMSTAPASAAGTSCVPPGAEIIQQAGTTSVWRYTGGPMTACGTFGPRLQLTKDGAARNGRVDKLAALTQNCAIIGSHESFRAVYAEQYVDVIDLGARTERRSTFGFGPTLPDGHAYGEMGRVMIGDGCSAAFEIFAGPSGFRIVGVDARGETEAADGTSLEDYARELRAPVAGMYPVASLSKGGSRITSAPEVVRFRGGLTILKLRFAGYLQYMDDGYHEVPRGLTIMLGGKIFRAEPKWNDYFMEGGWDPTGRIVSGIEARRTHKVTKVEGVWLWFIPWVHVRLPYPMRVRLKSGRSYRLKLITCNNGCIAQTRTVRVLRRGGRPGPRVSPVRAKRPAAPATAPSNVGHRIAQ